MDGKWVSIWKHIDFKGFRWIENGFQYGKKYFLMVLDGFKMGFNMEKYRF